jgi:hypothetical protein
MLVICRLDLTIPQPREQAYGGRRCLQSPVMVRTGAQNAARYETGDCPYRIVRDVPWYLSDRGAFARVWSDGKRLDLKADVSVASIQHTGSIPSRS